MTLLHRVSVLTLRDRMRSLNIRKELGLDLYTERNGLGWASILIIDRF